MSASQNLEYGRVSPLRLTLYVTPESSSHALANLYKALRVLAYTDYELDLVDVQQFPDKARKNKVSSTPALVYHADNEDILVNAVNDIDCVRRALRVVDRRSRDRIEH